MIHAFNSDQIQGLGSRRYYIYWKAFATKQKGLSKCTYRSLLNCWIISTLASSIHEEYTIGSQTFLAALKPTRGWSKRRLFHNKQADDVMYRNHQTFQYKKPSVFIDRNHITHRMFRVGWLKGVPGDQTKTWNKHIHFGHTQENDYEHWATLWHL